MWESHSDSNRIAKKNVDSKAETQSGDSRTWERKKVTVVVDRWEPEMEVRKEDRKPKLIERLGVLWQECMAENDRKQSRSPGNERGFVRVGQPLGPRRIKAPLTLEGVPPPPIKERVPPWQMPRVDGGSSQWRVDGREFPALGTQKTARKVIGSADPDDTGRGRQPSGHPIPIPRVVGRGMRPAKNIRSVWKGNRDVRTRGVRDTLTSPLSPLAKSFTPRPTSEKQQNQRQYTDNDLHRSKISTIGTAKPIEIEKPVAMADVAEPRGPARAGAGGPVVTEISMTAATDRTGASGPRRSKTDAPVIPEFR